MTLPAPIPCGTPPTYECRAPGDWPREACVVCGLPTGYRDKAQDPLCVPCHDALCAKHHPDSGHFLHDFTTEQKAAAREELALALARAAFPKREPQTVAVSPALARAVRRLGAKP